MILQRLTLVTALNSLVISVLLLGLYQGFEFGFSEYNSSRFTVSGEGVYEFLARCYFSICFWLFVFIIGHLIQQKLVSQIICFSSLVFVILSYRWVYLEKNLLFENSETITNVLRATLPLDLVNFSLVIILLIFQIIFLYRNFISRNQTLIP